MRVRYCRTIEGQRFPCEVGWCTVSWKNNRMEFEINQTEMKDCSDDPMEKNCRHIVEVDDNEWKVSLYDSFN